MTEDWKWVKVESPNCVTEWTLEGLGDVLCRFWYDKPPGDQALLIATAPATADERDKLLVKNEKLVKALDGLVTAIDDLVSESHGVDGLHLNGDVAPWDELLPGGQYESWLEAIDPARAALDEARKR